MATKCVFRPTDYFYISEFDAGPSGIQPYNFIRNGTRDIEITNYSPSDGYDNFDWYNRSIYSIQTRVSQPERVEI